MQVKDKEKSHRKTKRIQRDKNEIVKYIKLKFVLCNFFIKNCSKYLDNQK